MKAVISQYIPSEEAVQIVKNSQLLLIAGVVGAGKDTVVRELLKRDDFEPIVSYTTRPPRHNHGILEVDHQDYHFVSVDQALELAKEKKFVEVKYVHGNIYGTHIDDIRQIADHGKIATTGIDIDGVIEYLTIAPNIGAAFLIPPSVDIWLDRLTRRYGKVDLNDVDLQRRFRSAHKEIDHVMNDDRFTIVINDDLEKTVSVVVQCLEYGYTVPRSEAIAVMKHLQTFLSAYK